MKKWRSSHSHSQSKSQSPQSQSQLLVERLLERLLQNLKQLGVRDPEEVRTAVRVAHFVRGSLRSQLASHN